MRNAYLASIVGRIEADAETARIMVHRHAIEHGVKGASSIAEPVRSFVPNWRPRQDYRKLIKTTR
jgi:hypothetical protein